MTYGTTILEKKTDMRILEKQTKAKNCSFSLSSLLTTSSILWRKYIYNWYPLYGSEDLLFEFLNGLLDYPIMHTFSDKPFEKMVTS